MPGIYFARVKQSKLSAEYDFETRLYSDTLWITTKIASRTLHGLIAANSRLNHFCETQKQAGYTTPDTWPVLITVTKDEDEENDFMSFFVPNNTAMAEISVPCVKLQTRPGGTVYVRIFHTIPNLTSGRTNREKLREDLTRAGKHFDANTYSAAAYTTYWALSHYSEIWMSAV
ncbi:heme-binding protein soul2 isoform X2 [Nerophis ophidion]|uniref:heme-binding protein soul2 isoform X2 n=1 Tax=Nerophis ophidion TaxID=159077 RepID=UPI002AE0744F|nr:heme-binding protein soul2 isoform X2 [Nerophis ophidion]